MQFGGASTFAEATAVSTAAEEARPRRRGVPTDTPVDVPAAGTAPERGDRLPYWPGLDGVRAFAVVGVLLFHAGVTWLPGGLLGVDVFFVLSGFLITSLLLDERLRTGGISLRAFWAGRVRRLLPALLLLLLAVAGCASLVAANGDLGKLRDDALAALFYVANWRFAFSGQDYFDRFGDPSPLLHLWSLGVEEQFYLLWPLLVLLVARRTRRPNRAVGLMALVLALASTGLLAWLESRGADRSRLYYGTDTRAMTLLVGATLACIVFAPRGRHRQRFSERPLGRVLLAGLGLVGAGTLGYIVATVHGEDARLYSGGFGVVALATAAVLASVVLRPRAPLSRLLALPPLVAIGRISYGLYLWHWPIFLVLDPGRTALDGAALLGVRLAATLVIATASYVLVEKPIRQSRRPGRWRMPRLRLLAPTASAFTAAAVAIATVPGVLPTPAGKHKDNLNKVADAEYSERQRLFASPPPSGTPLNRPLRILMVGDSVGLTAGAALRRVQGDWDVKILNDGLAGCGLAPGSRQPDRPDRSLPDGLLCSDWPRLWQNAVDRFRPDVVLVLAGRWETQDTYVDSKLVSIGTPDFDTYLAGAFDSAIQILSSRAAHVGMVTSPCTESDQTLGTQEGASSESRQHRYNELLRAAVARHPGQAETIDLNALLCPDDEFTSYLDGTRVRATDGTHIAIGAGAVISPLMLGSARRMAGLPERPG